MSYAAFLQIWAGLAFFLRLFFCRPLFLSPMHILFFSLVCIWYFISTCLANCDFSLYGHSGDSNPGNFLEYKNFLTPIFSVFICPNRALAVF